MRANIRLQRIVSNAVGSAWTGLPGYDRRDVARFVEFAVPLVAAGQREIAALTEAYLAASLDRAPRGVDPALVTGAAVRNGAEPREVYERPFIQVWSALKAGQRFEDAVGSGLARARATAEMDIQLSMRETLRQSGMRDGTLWGYQRVVNAGACAYCQSLNGAQFLKSEPAPIHPGCKCSFDAVPYTRRPARPTDPPADVAVREHGELGPILGSPDHSFTGPAQIS